MNNSECGRSLRSKIYAEWCNLDITNKVLLFIGVVLLLELIISIFLHAVNADTTTDSFFRLSLSSILGYFLGGMNTGPQSSSVADANTESNSPAQNFQNTTYIRTFFVAFVCLACIITLSVTTFLNQTGYEEGLIQLRNTISTTLGFLLSKAHRRN